MRSYSFDKAILTPLFRYKYENTVGGKEEKIAELTEADPVWVSVRHLHMKDAIDTLMTNFGKFAQEHAGFRGYVLIPLMRLTS